MPAKRPIRKEAPKLPTISDAEWVVMAEFWRLREATAREVVTALEGRQQWKNAVAVYEKMARVPGPHVAQARQRIKTLQLSRYLWD